MGRRDLDPEPEYLLPCPVGDSAQVIQGNNGTLFVRHDDGTFARYYHLTTNGALVTPGQRVAAGDTIGLSGDTGYSTTPHLHVDVTRECVAWGCQTIWIRFQNAGADTLVAGAVYHAR